MTSQDQLSAAEARILPTNIQKRHSIYVHDMLNRHMNNSHNIQDTVLCVWYILGSHEQQPYESIDDSVTELQLGL